MTLFSSKNVSGARVLSRMHKILLSLPLNPCVPFNSDPAHVITSTPHLNVCVLDEAEVELDGEQLHGRDVDVQLLVQQVSSATSTHTPTARPIRRAAPSFVRLPRPPVGLLGRALGAALVCAYFLDRTIFWKRRPRFGGSLFTIYLCHAQQGQNMSRKFKI